MKSKKIIAFTMSPIQSQFEVDRLEEEAGKLGIKVKRAMYREIQFQISNDKCQILVQGEEVTAENTMGCWFRVAGTKSGKYTEGRNMLIRLLGKKGVFCVNGQGYLNWTRMGKIAQHALYIVEGIPVVPTRIFYTKNQVSNFEDWGYPVIAKHERGYQGKSVRKFENWEEVERFLGKINEKNLGMFLWQKYLPTKWDLRVIVIGGKAIGAMKRSAVGEEFRSNYSLGGRVERWELSEKEKKLAEKVAKVCKLDYCGVDIMKDREGNNYILEVNRQCQFQGFEKATGINVAKAVVEMMIKMA
ncbi:MAG: RimK family alpha-L-glutamate ligase [Patescibacteria group bacterium]